MRIALLSWESLHSVPVGGVAPHVTELAAALERRGHEVHVFTRMGEGQTLYDQIHGVHYHRCPIELNPDFVTEMHNMGDSFTRYLLETEAYQGACFDIVHGHDWMCASGVMQLKRNLGRRTILTIHSTEFGRCGNRTYDGVSARIRALEREGISLADRVITVSGYLADEVKLLYEVPDWKLRVVYNGVNCQRFDGGIDPAVCRRRYGIGPLDPMVLFVGRLSLQKGPDLLLEAVPGILGNRPDAKVVFVGDGHMRAELERRSHDLGISHAVRFTGALGDGGDIIDLFKSTDAVCVPSRNEPFGIVILEAWAAGKPVIVTANGGPRDFVAHGVDGLFAYDNPHSICWGVNTVFSDFAHARHMGQRGRVKAAYGFSWDAIAAQTEAVYEELM